MEEGLFIVAPEVIVSLVLGGILMLLSQIIHVLWLKPRRIQSKIQGQGIKGPSPIFLYGNIPEMKSIQLNSRSVAAIAKPLHLGEGETISHAWPAAVFPHIEQWRKEYGSLFLYSTGNIQILCVLDPEMVKEVSCCTSLKLGKPSYLSRERGPLLGTGILSSNGPYWAHQRKIIASEFYLEKVKGMISLMVDSMAKVLQSWESKIENQPGDAEIRVDEDMRSLSADIISRACFGSSYSQGEEIFLKLHALEKVMSKVNLGVPGLRHFPSKYNREMWRLKKEIDSVILDVVNIRRQTRHEKDLLQLILDAAKSDEDKDDLPKGFTPNKFIIDNCKNIYFAGHETTANSSSWCLILLAAYPEWQTRVRAEVLEICKNLPPDAAKLRSMKMLTMFIQEALRLYPPVAFVVREALEDINFRGVQFPKGLNIQIVIPFLHQHPEVWGPDAHQFNPERFAQGITKACRVPQAYMPFGIGARTCAGQHFAMAELKVILSLILSRFSFSLSPVYHHSPVFRLTIQPEHAINLRIRRL